MCLNEFYRTLKPDGVFIIDDGYQPHAEIKLKINESKMRCIKKETKDRLTCSAARDEAGSG